MQIYQCSQIGNFHINHNEDALSINEIGNNKIILAVMDGCSAGKESHFASTLIAKILKAVTKQLSYRAFVEKREVSIEAYLKIILDLLFEDLIVIKNQLLLEKEELLSTLIIAVIDKHLKTGIVLTIGDGLLCINGELIEYNQENQPDYIGYHLQEEFENWFNDQHQKVFINNIKDLSICTDGIFTFSKFDTKDYSKTDEEALIHFLLKDLKWQEQENMLNKKIIEIENEYGLKPNDDLSIIRIIFD